jgi:hypothetical protein
LEEKIEGQLKEAKLSIAGKEKRKAVLCLKRKKMYEAEVNRVQGARLTLTQQIMALESAMLDMEMYGAITTGTGAMANPHGRVCNLIIVCCCFCFVLSGQNLLTRTMLVIFCVYRSANEVDEAVDEISQRDDGRSRRSRRHSVSACGSLPG